MYVIINHYVIIESQSKSLYKSLKIIISHSKYDIINHYKTHCTYIIAYNDEGHCKLLYVSLYKSL